MVDFFIGIGLMTIGACIGMLMMALLVASRDD